MGLESKSILALVDEEAVRSSVETSVKPLVKTLIFAKNSNEAQSKLNNQQFDAIILRTKAPVMGEQRGVFNWSLTNKDYKLVPWIVLGKDVENEEVVIKNNHVKFLPDPSDPTLLVKMLSSVFFTVPPKGSASIDVEFINPLVKAVIEVLKTMSQLELQRDTPFVKLPGQASTIQPDISGVIAMNSNFFLGSLAISFEEKLILKIFEKMLGTKATTLNDDVKDCVSEITNVIFGNAKRDLNAIGHTIAAALPSVVTGKNHEIRHSITGHCICVPFSCADGKLNVECMISAKR